MSPADALQARVQFIIGGLDRHLSELKLLALDEELDAADQQTVKHHAEDCIGLGWRVLNILAGRKETCEGYKVGQPVEKISGDYTFVGTVVASFRKLGGARRYVVEDDRGVLHVYSHGNLRARP